MKRYYALEVENRVADIDIYGDITSWPWVESDVSAYNLSAQLAQLDVDEINVNINSYGGEVAEGLAIFNALKRHKAKINTRCDGFACSIASVIFMAGDKRVMNDASLLMIHNAWTYASGDANELRKQADDLDLITDQSKKIYLSKVSISEDELAQLMDEETFIDSDAAIEMGFATDVANNESDKPAQCARNLIYQALTDEEKPTSPTDEPGIEIEDPEDDEFKESEDDADKNTDDTSSTGEESENETDSETDQDDGSNGDDGAGSDSFDDQKTGKEDESDSNNSDDKQDGGESQDSDDEESDEVSKQYANFFAMIN